MIQGSPRDEVVGSSVDLDYIKFDGPQARAWLKFQQLTICSLQLDQTGRRAWGPL
jgi:hypothetical protein